MATEVTWRCLKCLGVNESKDSRPMIGPWTCKYCHEKQVEHSGALNGSGDIIACPVCGCPDLYRQRDFNRKLGFMIVLVGAILAPWTHFISIAVCALIDVILYYVVPDAAMCYYCHAIMRGYPGMKNVPLFELNTSDKYIDVERKRGW